METVNVTRYGSSVTGLGTFRDILDRAAASRTGYAMNVDNPALPDMVANARFGDNDPLKPAQIKVRQETFRADPTAAEKTSSYDLYATNAVAVKLNFESFDAFCDKLKDTFRDRCRNHGIAVKPDLPMERIARALLSTDYARGFLLPSSVGNSKIGSFIRPDAEKITEVALAVAALVQDGLLAESDIFAYVNRRVCDVRSTQDMAETAQSYLNGVRQKLESSDLISFVHGNADAFMIAAQQQEEKGDADGAQAYRDRADILYKAVSVYQEALDAYLPRELFAVPKKGKEDFESPVAYLETQSKTLEKFLKKTFNKKCDPNVFTEAEKQLRETVSSALKDEAGNPISLPPADTDGRRIAGFVDGELHHALAALKGQMDLSLRCQVEDEVRQAQVKGLAKLGFSPDVPPREGKFSVNLGLELGGAVGLKRLGQLRIGATYDFRLDLSIDNAGRVTVTHMHRGGVSISLAAKGSGWEAGGGIKAGVGHVSGYTYPDLKSFLNDSGGDLLPRLYGGLSGLFHSKYRTDRLAKCVDNQTFSSYLRELGVLRNTDTFCTRPVNRKIRNEFAQWKADVAGSGYVRGGGWALGKGVAKGSLKVSSTWTRGTKTSRQKVTDGFKTRDDLMKHGILFENGHNNRLFSPLPNAMDVEIANLFKSGEIKGLTRKQRLRASLKNLEEEYANFEQSVRYADFKALYLISEKIRYVAPPKFSWRNHLAGLFPGTEKMKDDPARARYLQYVACKAAALRIALKEVSDAEPDPDSDSELKSRIEELEQRAYEPDFTVSETARLRFLYQSTTTKTARTWRLDGSLSVRANTHLPDAKVKGTDMLAKIAPGLHADFNYNRVFAADRTGLPHEDASTLEFTIGTAGVPMVDLIGKIATNVVHKATGGAQAKDAAFSMIMEALRDIPVFGLVKNAATKGSDKVENRFLVNPDGKKMTFQSEGDSGMGFRFRFVKTQEGGFTLEAVQSVLYSDSQNTAGLSIGNFYGNLTFGTSSNTVIRNWFKGTSLVPFLKTALAFNVGAAVGTNPSWRAFLAQQEKAVDQLTDALKNPQSKASKELAAYRKALGTLKPTRDDLEDRLDAVLKAVNELPGLKAQNLDHKELLNKQTACLTELFTVLGKVTDAVHAAQPKVDDETVLPDEFDNTERNLQLFSQSELLDGVPGAENAFGENDEKLIV